MGMSTHVIGFRPPDKQYKEYQKIYEACTKAKISVPKEVSDFFDGYEPDDEGFEVDLEDEECVSEWNDEYRSGFEIDISLLPKDMKIIRVYNSW